MNNRCKWFTLQNWATSTMLLIILLISRLNNTRLIYSLYSFLFVRPHIRGIPPFIQASPSRGLLNWHLMRQQLILTYCTFPPISPALVSEVTFSQPGWHAFLGLGEPIIPIGPWLHRPVLPSTIPITITSHPRPLLLTSNRHVVQMALKQFCPWRLAS